MLKKMLIVLLTVILAVSSAVMQDAEQKELEKRQKTLLYGLETDVTSLIDTLIKEKDTSFTQDIRTVFDKTSNPAVKEKIFSYYKAIKDKGLQDYALTVLEDPYDQEKQLVSSVFSYVSELEIKEAAPFITILLRNENEDYFDLALAAIGKIGNAEDAVFLAEFLKTAELSTARKQALMKTLGQLKAVETWDSLVEIIKDEDENTYVRMYAAEAIGAMQKEESIEVLSELFTKTDVNLRTSAVKGLSNFNTEKTKSIILDAFKDNYYKVRLEAASAAKKYALTEAVPYLIYRSENDPENTVKYACYDALGSINNEEAREFLRKTLENKKINDTSRAKAASVILENSISDLYSSVITAAQETLKDDKLKNLRYAIGKEIAKYEIPDFSGICAEYLAHKDVATKGTGIDIFMKNNYPDLVPVIQAIAANEKEGSNQRKAKLALEKAGLSY